MHCLNLFNGFQLDNYFAIDKDIQAMLTNHLVLIENIARNLSLNRAALGLQFEDKSIFVNSLQETRSEFSMHRHCGTNDLLRQFLQRIIDIAERSTHSFAPLTRLYSTQRLRERQTA